MSDIYNKNAREKALLEEAYSYVYNEGQIDWKKATKGGKPAIQAYKDELKEKGHRKFKGPEGTTGATIPPGKEYKKDVDDLLARGYTEIGIEDAEDADDEWNRAENERESARDRAGELSDDWMEQDYKGRQEREDNIEYSKRLGDHSKGVKMAIEALGMFKDELHIDGHSEDINVNELADAHDQLSRALHWILDETDVEYITGGRADRAAERDLDFKPADGREY